MNDPCPIWEVRRGFFLGVVKSRNGCFNFNLASLLFLTHISSLLPLNIIETTRRIDYHIQKCE